MYYTNYLDTTIAKVTWRRVYGLQSTYRKFMYLIGYLGSTQWLNSTLGALQTRFGRVRALELGPYVVLKYGTTGLE